MAWIFSLSAECGTQGDAEAFARYFENRSLQLGNGAQYVCSTWTFQGDGDYWTAVTPLGVTQIGIRDQDDRRALTEIGFKLYDYLREAPSYRYALVGIEVDGFCSCAKLSEEYVSHIAFNGLVISNVLWQRLGSSSLFVPFSPGYRWRPFTELRQE